MIIYIHICCCLSKKYSYKANFDYQLPSANVPRCPGIRKIRNSGGPARSKAPYRAALQRSMCAARSCKFHWWFRLHDSPDFFASLCYNFSGLVYKNAINENFTFFAFQCCQTLSTKQPWQWSEIPHDGFCNVCRIGTSHGRTTSTVWAEVEPRSQPRLLLLVEVVVIPANLSSWLAQAKGWVSPRSCLGVLVAPSPCINWCFIVQLSYRRPMGFLKCASP